MSDAIYKNRTILVVDDEERMARFIRLNLEQDGFHVVEAHRGMQAIEAVRVDMPDVVVLDVMMPDLDGFETCRRLKADDSTSQIPVIFLTSLSEVSDKVKGFQAGGVDFITKPFQIEEVLARVDTHLTIRRLQVRLEATNTELQIRNNELQEALATIKTLSGLVPICAWCNSKIKDESNRWVSVTEYLQKKTDAQLSHGICPDCMAKLEADQL